MSYICGIMSNKTYCYDNIWDEGSDAGKEMLARLCVNVGELCKIK